MMKNPGLTGVAARVGAGVISELFLLSRSMKTTFPLGEELLVKPLLMCQGQHPGDPMVRLPQGHHMAVLGHEPSTQTTPAPALLKAISH